MEEQTFTRDERDELAHAFLHTLLCFFCNFCILWESRLHNPRDWSKVTDVRIRVFMFGGRFGWARRLWRLRRGIVGHDRMCDSSDTVNIWKRLTVRLNDWPVYRPSASNSYVCSKRCQSRRGLICGDFLEHKSEKRELTICYG